MFYVSRYYTVYILISVSLNSSFKSIVRKAQREPVRIAGMSESDNPGSNIACFITDLVAMYNLKRINASVVGTQEIQSPSINPFL